MPRKPQRLLTIGEVAHRAAVTTTTVRRWTELGLLTPVQYTAGGHARYALADVEALLTKANADATGSAAS
jgi:DNA-binding transcriptional MerR regulator